MAGEFGIDPVHFSEALSRALAEDPEID
jgi:hypothetical protein